MGAKSTYNKIALCLVYHATRFCDMYDLRKKFTCSKFKTELIFDMQYLAQWTA